MEVKWEKQAKVKPVSWDGTPKKGLQQVRLSLPWTPTPAAMMKGPEG
jgi:hypothetical protein